MPAQVKPIRNVITGNSYVNTVGSAKNCNLITAVHIIKQ